MKEDSRIDKMKIIDYEVQGSNLMLCLSDKADNYWGDDWDDCPYEHNAGPVYEEFVAKKVVLHFPWGTKLIEPNYNTINSPYTKEMIKENKIPCCIICNYQDLHRVIEKRWDYNLNTYYEDVVKSNIGVHVNFNDSLKALLDQLSGKFDVLAIEEL